MAKIRPFYESDLVKIITGIRRCGKSAILKSIYDEISSKSTNAIFLDFEDAVTLKKVGNVDKLLEYVENNRKEGKCYIFLDEIPKCKRLGYSS